MDYTPYSIQVLSKKYDGFQQLKASCKIAFGGGLLPTSFDSSQMDISDVEVNLSSESVAGSCSFKLKGLWRPSSTDWESKLSTFLKIGDPVTVSLGYVTKGEVFYGYIDSITYVYPTKGDEPYIHIYALDALGFLMNVRDSVYVGENDTETIIKKMLNAAVSAKAAKSVSTGLMPLQDFSIQRIKSNMSNYDFLKILAEQTGRKFFAVKGEVMFEDVMSISVPLFLETMAYTIASDTGFYYVERSLCLERQPKKVIVRGRDVNNNAIKGQASITTRTGTGVQASLLASSVLGEAVYDEDSPLVRTQMDCMDLAQTRFDALAMNFVRVRAICNGIPEIVPGRFLKIDGIGTSGAGTYFITGVRHTFTKQGGSFKTEVEMRGAVSL